jgi:hypothetical protein
VRCPESLQGKDVLPKTPFLYGVTIMKNETEAQRIAREDREAANNYRRYRLSSTRTSRAKAEQEDWEIQVKAKREAEARTKAVGVSTESSDTSGNGAA